MDLSKAYHEYNMELFYVKDIGLKIPRITLGLLYVKFGICINYLSKYQCIYNACACVVGLSRDLLQLLSY